MESHSEVSHADIYNAITRLRDKIEETYVTKAEFGPVKNITYGMVGIILTAVTLALLAFVIKGNVFAK